jgi:predicted alpha/beta-fold hydrolase
LNRFTPAPLLGNTHAQSILASLGLRRALIRYRFPEVVHKRQSHILEAGTGVRLHAEYLPQDVTPASKGMAVLLHGWEGSSQSVYLLSATGRLYREGFDVLCLHMRDHGPSHHLNEAIFNSSRHMEVALAIQSAFERWSPQQIFLAGYSLGGNFALRIGLVAKKLSLPLAHIVAVCPLVDPCKATEQIEQGPGIYHRYFLKKWQRSLLLKMEHFPHYAFGDRVTKANSLTELMQMTVLEYTEFESLMAYYDAYRLNDGRLENMDIPATLVASEDDPVCNFEAARALVLNPATCFMPTPRGGHCGYIKNWRLESWIDDLLIDCFRS